jgi:hypothetical protein
LATSGHGRAIAPAAVRAAARDASIRVLVDRLRAIPAMRRSVRSDRSLRATVLACALASTLGSLGCASGGGSAGAPPIESSRTVVSTPANASADVELYRDTRLAAHVVKSPPADVWKALPAAYADLGLTGGPAIGQQQTFAAVLPTVRRQLNKVPLSRFLDCGTTAAGVSGADVHMVRLQVSSIVEPQPAGTRVRTQVLARATSVENSNGAMDCSSTGVLEQRLAQALDARLGVP